MKKEELDNLIKQQPSLKDLPNDKLIEMMDLLTKDFESTKENIINSTRYLDTIEELYNRTLKVYQDRTNGR
jgi:hypothetical protein